VSPLQVSIIRKNTNIHRFFLFPDSLSPIELPLIKR
jgi:hypothetical protein